MKASDGDRLAAARGGEAVSPTAPQWHRFDDRQALADALAARIAAQMGRAIAADGQAILAVSGGQTPKLFFETLSRQALAWEAVTICLVDERFVPPSHPRSNQRLVEQTLRQNRAASARVMPLYQDGEDVEAAASRADAAISNIRRPFDAVVLGMGTDGHTASFFPGADRLAEATDMATGRTVVAIRAPGAGEPRLTMTLPRLVDATLLVLHIEGEAKRAVIDAALKPGPVSALPVRAVCKAAGARLEIFWSA